MGTNNQFFLINTEQYDNQRMDTENNQISIKYPFNTQLNFVIDELKNNLKSLDDQKEYITKF